MARFIFQLDGVLQNRERIEEDRQRELAEVQSEMVRLESRLQALDAELRQSTEDVRNHHMVGKLDMNYLAAHRRYMLGMQRKVMTLAEKMGEQKVRVDAARRALEEASRQKKTIEKLRERHFAQWTALQARREANALDELTTQMSYQNLAEDAP